MNKNDMYSHLINGGDPQVLLDNFMKELNDTQKEVDQKKEAERLEAQKQKEAEATTKKEKTLRKAREAVVAAFTSYITLVLGEEISEDVIRASFVELEESIAAIKKIRVSINGDELKSIFDLFL